MPAPPERTALYRFYDADGALLYVGIAKDIRKRWQIHATEKPWWHLVDSNRVEWLSSREEARSAELTAMTEESPLYNGVWHPDGTYTQGKYDDSAERDHATEQLRSDLACGALRSGDLVRAVELGRRYGVSAISVSMAFESLPPGTAKRVGNLRYIA